MIKKRSKTIVVLGMHKSGTSMVAGVLYKLGISIGKELIKKHWSNPLGHFEDKDFFNLNREILKAAGGRWDLPPDQKAILKQGDIFKEKIINLVSNKSELWGWKDPRTNLTIELYLPYLKNPYFLVCYRDSEAVAKSLFKRNKIENARAKILKGEYDSRIKEFFEKYPYLPRLDLQYEKVISQPVKWVNEIINFLDIQVEDEKKNQAIRFILPNKNMHELSKKLLNKDHS
ncbi:MAG: hypothetical protein FH762_00690 [Firmicutes bacterium]|nr:hypothetical protein [Bacillota bacterium]